MVKPRYEESPQALRLIKKLALLYRMVRQSFSFAEKAAFFRHIYRKFVLFFALRRIFFKKGLNISGSLWYNNNV